MKKSLRILSVFLSIVMVLGMFPMAVNAESATDEKFSNSQLTVATEKISNLAPGIELDSYTTYDKNGDQVKMFVTTADMSVDTVKLFTSYKDMNPTPYGMAKVTEQAVAFNAKAESGDEYYQGTVVAGINAAYYNTKTGQPTGAFVMNGVAGNNDSAGNAYGYFAVMKDGSVKIGNKGDYAADKANIQEAIGIYTMLVVDGVMCANLNDVDKYPRQTIGITADGNVILMTADGNQAPSSIGLTVKEQAQVMLDLGCVWAGHLDGGGSCTYAAKAEGSNDFNVVNSPSNGSERAVSNGLLVVSTAVSDGKFHSASLSAENEYVTPGSTVNVFATGVDRAGGPAEIPADVKWQLADSTMGTVENGVFVSNGKVGEAVVQMTYNGSVVGEASVNVVIPNSISFGREQLTVPYGETVEVSITALYGVKDVAYNASDIKLSLADATVGTIEGLKITSPAADSGITDTTLTATLVADTSVTATVAVKYGKASEVLFDFEKGTEGADTDNWIIRTHESNTANNEQGCVYVVNKDTGLVHDGDQALAFNCDFSQTIGSGSSTAGYLAMSMSWGGDPVSIKGAQSLGFWVYIPEDAMTTEITVNTVYNDGKSRRTKDAFDDNGEVIYTPYWSTHMEESGWQYVRIDLSAFTDDLYIMDAPNLSQAYKRNFFIKMYCVFGADTISFSDFHGDHTYYIDNITVDYSDAVADRERPVFGDASAYGVGSGKTLAYGSVTTVAENALVFSVPVTDNTVKSNYVGIDSSSAKVYVDGNEVAASYTGGVLTSSEVVLADGYHRIRFEIADNNGNVKTILREINVNVGSDIPTIKLVARDATLDRLLSGSVYWIDLTSNDIANIEKIETIIDVNSINEFILDQMVVADGFDVTYKSTAAQDAENTVALTITRNGEEIDADNNVVLSIPIRIWESLVHTYAGHEADTPEFLWTSGAIDARELRVYIAQGLVTFTDGASTYFSGDICVDTEAYTHYYNMDTTYHAEKGSYHVHTAVALADVAATCTENGYSDRTFCEGCNSVVEWGKTLKATGHSYKVTDGKLACSCGELFSGEYTDGKTYVDGVVVADGWIGDSYYKSGVKLTGLQMVDGYYYDFGDNGVCEGKAKADGFCYNQTTDAYMYLAAGIPTTGDLAIAMVAHFFDENGYAYSGERNILGYTCTFDEKGMFLSADDSSVLEAGCVGTNLEYVLLSDGTLIIDGEGDMRNYTMAGSYGPWFYGNKENVKYVEFGANVTKVGDYAFNLCEYIKTVNFAQGSKLETIGTYAFRACHRLDKINIPANVTTIEDYAFFKCGGLTTVDFEANSNLKYIGREAFAESHYLKKIMIPASVTTIGDGIFKRSKANVVVQVVKDSVAYFYAVNNSINYELIDGVVPALYSGDVNENISWALYPNGSLIISGNGDIPNYASQNAQPWAGVRHLVKKIVIGKDITAIGNYAFAYCESTEEIVFEEGSKLESIGVLSFRSAFKVTEVVLPETVTNLATYAFGTCKALVNVYIPQGMEFMHAKAFIESSNVVLNVADGTYAEKYAVDNNVSHTVRDFVYIPVASGSCGENATWAFYENGELIISGSGQIPNYASQNEQPWAGVRHLVKKIVIGKDITAIGNYAFAYCEYTEEVVFEEGSKLEKIGVLSFRTLRKVTEITLPETVNYLNAYAFGTCPALVNIYIPQGMSFMHAKAFIESPNVVLNVADGTYAEEYAVDNGINHTVRDFIYIPVASGNCGENATWAFYENGELVISGSGDIPNYASQKEQPWASVRHLVKKIVIGKDITAIGNYAFAYCEYTEEVVFEEGSKLEKIGVLSFRTLRKVTEITLPETVNYLNAYAFGTCPALVNIYIPQGMSFMHVKAFIESPNVILDVAEGTYSQEYATANSIKYETRDFEYIAVASGSCGENATWAFYENGELVISGSGAMDNYASHKEQPWASIRHLVKKIVIGKDITTIGNYAFAYCEYNEEIVFEGGSKLEKIGVLAFRSNRKVKEVVLPETVAYINTYAFGTCDSLVKVYIPEEVGFIHAKAFIESPNVVVVTY